ncbi:MAG TPA: hypothetical protein VF681_06630 [Abditibacteriaceae bacterium]|jgi:hypothetical protein
MKCLPEQFFSLALRLIQTAPVAAATGNASTTGRATFFAGVK